MENDELYDRLKDIEEKGLLLGLGESKVYLESRLQYEYDKNEFKIFERNGTYYHIGRHSAFRGHRNSGTYEDKPVITEITKEDAEKYCERTIEDIKEAIRIYQNGEKLSDLDEHKKYFNWAPEIRRMEGKYARNVTGVPEIVTEEDVERYRREIEEGRSRKEKTELRINNVLNGNGQNNDEVYDRLKDIEDKGLLLGLGESKVYIDPKSQLEYDKNKYKIFEIDGTYYHVERHYAFLADLDRNSGTYEDKSKPPIITEIAKEDVERYCGRTVEEIKEAIEIYENGTVLSEFDEFKKFKSWAPNIRTSGGKYVIMKDMPEFISEEDLAEYREELAKIKANRASGQSSKITLESIGKSVIRFFARNKEH